MAEAGQLKCVRNGCGKKYQENENNGQACNFHPGKPIFHDLKKGWTCCNQIVYDWDEFEKIPKCATGEHTNIKTDANLKGQDQFFKSDTVSNADNAQKKHEEKEKVKINKISDYNKKVEEKQKEKEDQEPSKVQEIVVLANGNYKCINKGCQKEFDPKENQDTSCNYHSGQPVFHDLKKYWTCCKKETYDWDDFMKLPTCTVGKHVPKTK
ncbi:hypothetical protein PPERSA_07710 [Pseudocohnilembus persalinus]|uniref:CHORD domain-containing protein n=1 Tax=Pseudocohnilembus persalinus TaxID=266149 RepID=A0A0V0R0Z4_PSEPJ|nr:hypothetical protein PPERSA_07710 [Pseudocohnilembus persalinus]|eukprot:KRX08230.1 hypothetical protein PPERSA_07710 [Pseudocohnilembus persalinus]